MAASRRVIGTAVAVLAAFAWTAAVGYLVAIGRLAAADTRCGHVEPRVDMEGGWIVIAGVTVWAAPFVAFAVARRRRWTIVVAIVVVVAAAAVVIEMFARPVAFCW